MKTKSKNEMGRMFVILVIMTITGINLTAQDWPQWRGANRDGVLKTTTNLNLNWSEKKPSLLWVFRQAGAGYTAPTIVGTTLYSQGAAAGKDFAFALDTKTGNLKWKQVLGEQFVQDRGDGPRGSVTVDGDKLYLIRGGGQIHCLSAADGKMLWQKDFIKDFGGKIMSQWGFSESPLVDGNLVVCSPGGANGMMVALDKNTGKVVWRSTEWKDDAGYSSPIVAEADGIRQYIQQSAKGFAGVSAKDGKVLWKVIVPEYKIATIPTPVFKDNMVYFVTGYNVGCNALRLSKEGNGCKAETVYANKNIVNQHGGVVLMDGYIYGFSDGAGFVCQNFKTGETVWKERNNALLKGAVLGVNDRLIVQNERNGLLAVIAASPGGWKEFGRMEFPERTKIQTTDNMVWTHPVVADGKLFLRDHDLLFCFDLK